MQLAPIPDMDEQLDRAAQGVERAREASGVAAQAHQVVAQLGVVRLHAAGLALTGRDRMLAGMIDQARIGQE